MSIEWISVADRLPGEHCPPLLVANNFKARNAFGHMSHVWVANMLHREKDRSFCAFSHDSDRKIHGISHWAEITPSTPTPEPKP